jgi:hypothetical protein
MVSAHRDGEDAESSDGYLSDGGDAVTCRKRLHGGAKAKKSKGRAERYPRSMKGLKSSFLRLKTQPGL